MTTKLQKLRLLQKEMYAFIEDVERVKELKAQLQYHLSALEALATRTNALGEETLMKANRIMKLAVELESPPEVIALAKEAIEVATAFNRERPAGVI